MDEHLTLGDLVEKLDGYVGEHGQDHAVRCGFAAAVSYRGNYAEIAFAPEADTRLGAMLGEARRAIGATYTGYKGGDFDMTEETPVWLAAYGDPGPPLSDGLLHAMVLGRLWGGPMPDNSSLPPNIQALESHFSAAIECAPFLEFELESVLNLATEWCVSNDWRFVMRLQPSGAWCVTLNPGNGADLINVDAEELRVALMRACVLAAAENVKEE